MSTCRANWRLCGGCGKIVEGRCECQKRRPPRRNAEFRKRYQCARWKALRKVVMRRDEGACVMCGQMATEIDHILRADLHPELFYELDNLQALCKPCHSRKTQAEGRLHG